MLREGTQPYLPGFSEPQPIGPTIPLSGQLKAKWGAVLAEWTPHTRDGEETIGVLASLGGAASRFTLLPNTEEGRAELVKFISRNMNLGLDLILVDRLVPSPIK